jgi:hypothetical protein
MVLDSLANIGFWLLLQLALLQINDSREISPVSLLSWNWGRVEKIRQSVETITSRQETTATVWGPVQLIIAINIILDSFLAAHLGRLGVVRILKEVPEVSLDRGAATGPEVIFLDRLGICYVSDNQYAQQDLTITASPSSRKSVGLPFAKVSWNGARCNLGQSTAVIGIAEHHRTR